MATKDNADDNSATEQTPPPATLDMSFRGIDQGSVIKALGDPVGLTEQLARTARGVVSTALRSRFTAGLYSDAESRLAAFRRERKIGKGTLRDIHVATYNGYAFGGFAHVRVRVLEEPVLPAATDLVTDRSTLRTNLRRFAPLAFPGVRMQLRVDGTVVEAVTDRHGYALADIPVGRTKTGWHEYIAVTVPDDPTETPTVATGQFLVLDGRAPFAVISDIDDTVLRTGLTEGMVAVRNTLLRSTDARRAIPGMAALYDALANSSARSTGFFYLSTGPWTAYSMLTEFLATRGFPEGVLLLTDWGPQDRYIMRSGREHKRTSLLRLFQAYPKTNFVLVGDSGQNDPVVYTEIARAFPDRVRAIVILDVGEHMSTRREELLEQQGLLQEQGIPFFFVDNAAHAATVLADAGVIDQDAPTTVDAAYLRER